MTRRFVQAYPRQMVSPGAMSSPTWDTKATSTKVLPTWLQAEELFGFDACKRGTRQPPPYLLLSY